MNVGDVLEWNDGKSEPHRWRVRGIHLGGLGTESVIEVENVSHKPAWTGEWETHQLMFIPECLLRSCKRVSVAHIIDPDYRGEVKVLLYNGSHEAYYVRHEERIAQLFLVAVVATTIVELSELTETKRGEAGFGSTGQ